MLRFTRTLSLVPTFPSKSLTSAAQLVSTSLQQLSVSAGVTHATTSNHRGDEHSSADADIAEFQASAAGFMSTLQLGSDWDTCNSMMGINRNLDNFKKSVEAFKNSSPMRLASLCSSLLGRDEYANCRGVFSSAIQHPNLETAIKLLELLHAELNGSHNDLFIKLKLNTIIAILQHSDLQLLSAVLNRFLNQYREYRSFDEELGSRYSEKFGALLDFFINETQTGGTITNDNYNNVVVDARMLDHFGALFRGVSLTRYSEDLTRQDIMTNTLNKLRKETLQKMDNFMPAEQHQVEPEEYTGPTNCIRGSSGGLF